MKAEKSGGAVERTLSINVISLTDLRTEIIGYRVAKWTFLVVTIALLIVGWFLKMPYWYLYPLVAIIFFFYFHLLDRISAIRYEVKIK